MKPSILMVLTPAFAEAKAFYRDILGFHLATELSDIAIFALDGGAELHLFECAAPAPDAPHGEAAATVLVFEVDDLDARIGLLKSRGVVFLHETPAANPLFRSSATPLSPRRAAWSMNWPSASGTSRLRAACGLC